MRVCGAVTAAALCSASLEPPHQEAEDADEDEGGAGGAVGGVSLVDERLCWLGIEAELRC